MFFAGRAVAETGPARVRGRDDPTPFPGRRQTRHAGRFSLPLFRASGCLWVGGGPRVPLDKKFFFRHLMRTVEVVRGNSTDPAITPRGALRLYCKETET